MQNDEVKYNNWSSKTKDTFYQIENISFSLGFTSKRIGIKADMQNDLGNLIYKKTDGQVLFQNAVYGQNTSGPHALTSAATSAGVFSDVDQSIAYNAFDKVSSISEGNQMLQITYGHHRQRIGQQYTAAGSTTTKVYVGACEYITTNGQTTTHTYLSGPEGVFSLHVKNPKGSENIRYIQKDHLGSWNTISDENGNLLQELSFDAWGNRRNPATWRAFASTPPEPLFDRGFTGHEHLYGFQLINMNGRMYDPVVSRMLSPDNFIQAPDFSQSFNRYSYAWNNPLKYTDPDGEIIVESLILLGMTLAGGYLGGVASNEGELNPAKWDWRSETTYLGIGFGGLFGYVGGYGLINPGTVGLSLGVGTPAAGIYLTGQGSDWKFQWTTSAGGGGDINLSQPVTTSDVFNGSNHRVKLPVIPSGSYWDGRFYHGTEEEARRILVETSKLLGVETAYWSTNKGYYFSLTRGVAYQGTDMFGDGDWNTSLGYKENTISSAWRYVEVYKPDYDNLYILNPFVSRHGFVKVNYRAHTHPSSGPPSLKDLNHSFYLGYYGKVFGWNGVIYSYRGHGYIQFIDE